MAEESKSVVQALDRIGNILAASCGCGIEFPQLAIGPVEQVLGFNTDEFIVLKGLPDAPYFSSHGVITDLCHRVLPGTRVETAFPLDPSKLAELYTWPPKQPPPFDAPPVKDKNTAPLGSSKQAYFFADSSSLITIGPSMPKIAKLEGNNAQF